MLMIEVSVAVLVLVLVLVWVAKQDFGPKWHPCETGFYAANVNGDRLFVRPLDGTWGVCMYDYGGPWCAEIRYGDGRTEKYGGAFDTHYQAKRAIYKRYKQCQPR